MGSPWRHATDRSPSQRTAERRREGEAKKFPRGWTMPGEWLLYGAGGYTGRLIAREAVRQGLRPILAGRRAKTVVPMAAELGLPHRVATLDGPSALDAALTGVDVVLHCAGPFAHTSRPMVEACLRTRTHYLDITGEIPVFETLAGRDAEARAAGIMLLPGVGFDVVPSDCLAAHVTRRLPSAHRLALGFQGLRSRPSRGTMLTVLEHLHRGGTVRRGGLLVSVPAAWKTRVIDFGRGPTDAVTIPWGDVATAFYSTGIPNIEVYSALPPGVRRLLTFSQMLGRVLRHRAALRLLMALVRLQPPGPTDAQRARGASLLWAEAEDPSGRRVASRLRGPEGYTLTALTAVAVVARVLAGQAPVGFQTPARAYGADLILEIEGVVREDL